MSVFTLNKWILATLLLLSSFTSAQRSGLFSETLSASGVGTNTINAIASGSSSYNLVYDTNGTPGAVSIQIEGSTDSTTFSICGVAVTNTTSGSTSCTGTFQKVRANLTSLTGGTAPTVTYAISASYNATGLGTSASQVQGVGATGSTVVGNPVLIAGFDGTNTRTLQTNTGGAPVNAIGQAGTDGLSNLALGESIGTSGGLPLIVFLHAFNGSTWDRIRLSSSSTFPTSQTTTARNSIGAHITEKGSRWAVNSAPAAGSQATASIAAEAAVRHVLDSLCFSSGSAVAPALTSLQVNVRDGATGAGTVLLSFEVDIPATTGEDTPPVCISGLNLVGTTNTAMTVEWSAALANLKQTATAIGFNLN